MGVKKNLWIEEWDGLRSDVYKVFDLFNPSSAFAVLVGVFLVPMGIYQGCKWQQRIQDKEKYKRKGTEYFPQ